MFNLIKRNSRPEIFVFDSETFLDFKLQCKTSCTKHRFHGVSINVNLSWKNHVNIIATK